MRIAFFCDFPSVGKKRLLNGLAKRFKKTHTVDMYLIDNDVNKKEFLAFSNIRFYKFLIPLQGNLWPPKLFKVFLTILKIRNLNKKIAINIDKNNYDVALVFSSKLTRSPFLLSQLRTRNIYYCDGVGKFLFKPLFKYRRSEQPVKYLNEFLIKFLGKIIEKKNGLKADIILSNSNFTKKNLFKYYGLKSKVCYLGVDDKYFSPGNVNKNTDLLFIGSLDYGLDEFAFFKMVLNFIPQKINVKIMEIQNEISSKELLSLYRQSKIVVCTSRFKSFGFVPLEAMSCGCAVVAVNEGGYKETIIDNKTGFLVPRNPYLFAGKIEKLLKNKKLIKRFGTNGRENVIQNWSFVKNVSVLEKYIRHIESGF